jgi:Ca-activated chloride channel family protein
MAAVALILAACGGTAPPSPTPAATIGPPVETPPAATATSGATGPAAITAPDEVETGVEFEVAWTGPNEPGDYITLVAEGATEWTNEDYFYTNGAVSPGRLTAPAAAGSYELWYVAADETILARRPIELTPFQGSLQAPAEVTGNTEFEVTWQGPNGPGDYVTIVKAGATRWTNEDYFYTSTGNPGKLLAPIEAGAYEVWYVLGVDDSVQARRPIAVIAPEVTLDAPDSVARGATFEVAWTGPNGPGDYVTIVPEGSTPGTYLSYDYTTAGSPATLTAPDAVGRYEIWYAAGAGDVTLLSIPIVVN